MGRDKSVIVEFDPITAKEVRVLYANDDYDVNGVGYSRKRKVITAAYFESWKSERHYFDSTSKAIFEKIQKKLSGYEIGITAINKDENIIILRTYSDKSLGSYYIYNSDDDKMEKIVDVSPWINENEMSNQLPIDYQSRDGLKINGYLTLPKGYNMENAKNLPAFKYNLANNVLIISFTFFPIVVNLIDDNLLFFPIKSRQSESTFCYKGIAFYWFKRC